MTRPFNGRLGFRRRVAFNVRESVNECDLQLDLFATHDRRAGQGRYLVERPRELLGRFDQRRLRQRPLSRFAPKACGFLDQAGLGPMACQQLRSALGDIGELDFKRFGNAGMQRASLFAQQCAISGVSHQGMLE